MDFHDLTRPLDFAALARPVRFAQARANEVPAPFVHPGCTNRRLAALREAADVLAHLPGPGEALHAIMTGRYDLTDLCDVILARLGTVAHLRVATLSFNARNSARLRAWVDGRAVERLTLLCSKFFVRHFPEVYQEVRQALAPPHAVAASRNHCKLVCFHFADGRKMALEGSANLRTNSNTENATLIHDAAVHDFHAGYIDGEVSRHGGPEGE
jgi:hypothetical protein